MTEHHDPSDSQRDLVSAVLERLSLEDSAENDQRGISAQLKAAHLLVSAMDGERKPISAENRKQFFSRLHRVLCFPSF